MNTKPAIFDVTTMKNRKTRAYELTPWDNLDMRTQKSIDDLIGQVLDSHIELSDGTKGAFKDVYTGAHAPFYEYHLLSPATCILNSQFVHNPTYEKYGHEVRERLKKHILLHFYETMSSIGSEEILLKRKEQTA